MKFINKISLWFIIITVLLTPLCVVISYHGVRDKIDHTQIARMTNMNDNVAALIRDKKLTPDYTTGKPIQIEKVNMPMPVQTTQVFNGSNGEKNIDKDGYIITVTSYYKIDGLVYKISSFNYTTNTQQIFLGMLKGVLSKILLIGIAVILIARYFSKKMFLPFKESIRALNDFS
ncbi:MAG: hypothetical protein PW786_05510, partial [Arachidicoccus sp.]|nr:hypothetical protein [Arachidicoccus sp.]